MASGTAAGHAKTHACPAGSTADSPHTSVSDNMALVASLVLKASGCRSAAPVGCPWCSVQIMECCQTNVVFIALQDHEAPAPQNSDSWSAAGCEALQMLKAAVFPDAQQTLELSELVRCTTVEHVSQAALALVYLLHGMMDVTVCLCGIAGWFLAYSPH